jgi:hypothetical protein
MEHLKEIVGSTARRDLLSRFKQMIDDHCSLSDQDEQETTSLPTAVPSEVSILPPGTVVTPRVLVMDLRKEQIDYALALDLKRTPRLSCSGSKFISIHNRKQADKEDRNRTIQLAYWWGYTDPHLTAEQRKRIAMASCHLVAYDNGFSIPLLHTSFPAWHKAVQEAFRSGENTKEATTPKYASRQSYISKIEKDHPGYILELY